MQIDLDAMAVQAQSDPSVADELIEILLPAALKSCRRRVTYVPGEDQEDLVQVVRLAIWEAIQDYDIRKKIKFRHFALNIVVPHSAINFLRETQRHYSDPDPLPDDEEDQFCALADPKDDIASAILKMDLEDMSQPTFPYLTEKESAVLRASIEGSKQAEISREFGVSEKSVDGSLCRMRKKLRSCPEFLEWLQP